MNPSYYLGSYNHPILDTPEANRKRTDDERRERRAQREGVRNKSRDGFRQELTHVRNMDGDLMPVNQIYQQIGSNSLAPVWPNQIGRGMNADLRTSMVDKRSSLGHGQLGAVEQELREREGAREWKRYTLK